MSAFGNFFRAILPFSWSSAITDVDAAVKKIADKAAADIANIQSAAAKAQAQVSLTAKVQAVQNKLAADVASLQSAISALTAQAAKDVAALNATALPVPPVNPVPAPTGTTGASGPSA